MSRFGNLEFDHRHRERFRHDQIVSDERVHLTEAENSLRRGDFEQALRGYSRAMEANPQNPAGWVGQVRMLIELGDFDQANLWADKALEQFPRDPEALAAKAVALARLGDAKAALTFSDAAIEEEGQTPYVWLARGDVLLARAEKRAEYCFTKALALAGSDWLWPWLASRVHFFYRKFSLAMKLVSQALAVDSVQAVVWLQMGRCQLSLGLGAAAEESFARARELNPHCPVLHEAYADVRQSSGLARLIGRVRSWFGERG